MAAQFFARLDQPPPPMPTGKKGESLMKQRITEAATHVAKYLNNTPAIAKSSYINPAIIQAWVTEVSHAGG